MHRYRYWKTYPAHVVPRRPSRITATCLIVGEVLLAAAIVILFVFVLDLRAARTHEAAERQAAIDHTLCQILSQFPRDNPTLDRIREELSCYLG